MERAYWKASERTGHVHFQTFARATSGQVLLFWLHTELDIEERERRVHPGKCLAKLRSNLCEVCGEEVNILSDYADLLNEKAYSPREYVEHQLNMTEEEKETRRVFFEELFAKYDEQKAKELSGFAQDS